MHAETFMVVARSSFAAAPSSALQGLLCNRRARQKVSAVQWLVMRTPNTAAETGAAPTRHASTWCRLQAGGRVDATLRGMKLKPLLSRPVMGMLAILGGLFALDLFTMS